MFPDQNIQKFENFEKFLNKLSTIKTKNNRLMKTNLSLTVHALHLINPVELSRDPIVELKVEEPEVKNETNEDLNVDDYLEKFEKIEHSKRKTVSKLDMEPAKVMIGNKEHFLFAVSTDGSDDKCKKVYLKNGEYAFYEEPQEETQSTGESTDESTNEEVEKVINPVAKEDPNCLKNKDFIKNLNDQIKEKIMLPISTSSGFRWCSEGYSTSLTSIYFNFYCFQDNRLVSKQNCEPNKKSRTTFNYYKKHNCNSKVVVTFFPTSGYLRVRYEHIHHDQLSNTSSMLNSSSKKFIIDKVAERWDQDPMFIFEELKKNQPFFNCNVLTVKRFLKRTQRDYYQRHKDAIESSKRFIEENADVFELIDFGRFGGKSVGVGIKPNYHLIEKASHFLIDGTFGTVENGYQLHSIIMIIDGAGIPLVYFFVDSLTTDINMKVIHFFKDKIEERKVEKVTFLSDKDDKNISAIKLVLGAKVKVLLCKVHVVDAIVRRLTHDFAKNFENLKQKFENYPDWLKQRLNNLENIKHGAIKLNDQEKKQFRNFLFYLGTIHQSFWGSPIYQFSKQAALEFITFKIIDYIEENFERNYGFLGYMLENWILTDYYEMWTSSSYPDSISHIRTNNPLEGHWSLLKHTHLKGYIRPRIDTFFMVLKNRIIPYYTVKSQTIISKGFDSLPDLRAGLGSSWRLDFYNFFRDMKKFELKEGSFEKYKTSVTNWSCGCSHMNQRFYSCAHLVQKLGLESNEFDFFKYVERSPTKPYFRHEKIQSFDDGFEFTNEDNNQLLVNRGEEIPSCIVFGQDEDYDQSMANEENNNDDLEELESLKKKFELELKAQSLMIKLTKIYESINDDLENASPEDLSNLRNLPIILTSNKTTTNLLLHFLTILNVDEFNDNPIMTWIAPKDSLVSSSIHLQVQALVEYVKKGDYQNLFI